MKKNARNIYAARTEKNPGTGAELTIRPGGATIQKIQRQKPSKYFREEELYFQ
jgi:hypothetical protein